MRNLLRVLKIFWTRVGYGTGGPDNCVLLDERLWKDSTVFQSRLSQGAESKRTNSYVRIPIQFDNRDHAMQEYYGNVLFFAHSTLESNARLTAIVRVSAAFSIKGPFLLGEKLPETNGCSRY